LKGVEAKAQRPVRSGLHPDRGRLRIGRPLGPGGQTLHLVGSCYSDTSMNVGGATTSDGEVCSGPIKVELAKSGLFRPVWEDHPCSLVTALAGSRTT
jgi:hypothetical protein